MIKEDAKDDHLPPHATSVPRNWSRLFSRALAAFSELNSRLRRFYVCTSPDPFDKLNHAVWLLQLQVHPENTIKNQHHTILALFQHASTQCSELMQLMRDSQHSVGSLQYCIIHVTHPHESIIDHRSQQHSYGFKQPNSVATRIHILC